MTGEGEPREANRDQRGAGFKKKRREANAEAKTCYMFVPRVNHSNWQTVDMLAPCLEQMHL